MIIEAKICHRGRRDLHRHRGDSSGSPVTLTLTLIAKNTPNNCEPLGSISGCKS
jgi:hypothetical protein